MTGSPSLLSSPLTFLFIFFLGLGKESSEKRNGILSTPPFFKKIKKNFYLFKAYNFHHRNEITLMNFLK